MEERGETPYLMEVSEGNEAPERGKRADIPARGGGEVSLL